MRTGQDGRSDERMNGWLIVEGWTTAMMDKSMPSDTADKRGRTN